MVRRWVAGVLFTVAAIGAAATVWAGERHDRFGWGGGHWGMHGRWSALSAEDREAFTDARIAALHAGLKLNPEQDKLWPPVETAIRDIAKQREARRQARRQGGGMADDPPSAIRGMADAATARGEALRKLADATAPLYATLDDGQKRRATMLARPLRGGFGHGGWRRRMHDRGDED